MNYHKLKINLYGEAIRLSQFIIEKEQLFKFQLIANKLKLPLYIALIDPYFYHLLNDLNIKSKKDISIVQKHVLLNSNKNQIEIWYKNKKIQKLKINDLLSELLLFPLYNVELIQKTVDIEKGTYVEEKEIGLIGSYELKIQNFNINDLVFHLIENRNEKDLMKITYQDNEFELKKTDAVINYQNSYEI
ncbi:MAG: hypothetical protein V4548_08455 [Bacteroidota bacterium]